MKQNYIENIINNFRWINKHDPDNKHIFDGGFLGLDNISVLDRGRQLPQGITLEQVIFIH